MVNHFFIDAEYRMQTDYEIKQSRYIKNTLKTMLAQYHGSTLAYDEGLVGSDAVLAAAIWRNVFGAGWGEGMGGVQGKKPPKRNKELTDLPKFELESAPSTASEATSPAIEEELQAVEAETTESATERVVREARFAGVLEQLVRFVRSEVARLQALPDDVISQGPATGHHAAINFSRLSPLVAPANQSSNVN